MFENAAAVHESFSDSRGCTKELGWVGYARINAQIK